MRWNGRNKRLQAQADATLSLCAFKVAPKTFGARNKSSETAYIFVSPI